MIDTEDHNSDTELATGRQTKSEYVTDQLRMQIVTGLKPETKLGSYQELEESFGVSRAVVREAVNQLKREGFIYSVDRKGLYVANRPPHLSQFALVFTHNPSSRDWPRFFTALQQEAGGLSRDRGDIQFSNYYDVAGGPGTPSYERLLDDMRSHRLAGVLLLPPGHELGRTEPFATLDTPKLYICGATQAGCVPSVTTDQMQMHERMTAWLRSRGRQRIAVVAIWGNHETLQKRLHEQGVPHRPHWFQTVGRDNFADVRNVVALLMDYPADQRPDGLIIFDDNLTEHAVGGLLQSGAQIGQDIDVIAHCNWPWPVASPAPIQRVGFHARQVISEAVRAIELIRNNQPLAAEQVKIPALFEEEISLPWQPTAFDPAKE